MRFNQEELDRIVEMAWEDKTSFEAIKYQFGIDESQVMALMRCVIKKGSFQRG